MFVSAITSFGLRFINLQECLGIKEGISGQLGQTAMYSIEFVSPHSAVVVWEFDSIEERDEAIIDVARVMNLTLKVKSQLASR